MKNILHLSDFHVSDLPIGKGNSAHDLDIILSALISDIRGEFTGKKFDTIFITGDLAYHGRNAEYRIFQIHVIDILIRDLGVGRDNIFICPGNHDVDLKERSLAETMATGNSDNNTVMEGFWKTITQDEGQKHLGSLNAYHSWVSKNGNLLKRTGVFDVFTVKDGSNGVIGIISLNTAILANGGDLDHGKLRYPVEALEEAVKAIPVPNNGIIALIHHPVDWMARADRERLSKWLTGNVSMAFFGHLHEPDVSQEFSLNDITIRIQAGSFDRNSRQVGYNAIILDQENSLNTGTIFFRLMDCGRDGLRPGKSKFEKWIDRSRDGQFIFDLSDQIKFDTNEFSSSAGRLSDQIDEELLINVGQMGTKKKIVDIFDTPRLSLEEIKVIDYYENNSNNGEAKDLSDIESIASTEEIEFELIAKPSKNYLIRGTKNQGKTTLLKYIHYSHLRALEQKNYEMITVYINFDVESKVTYDHILTLACNQYETNNNRGMFTNKIKDFIKHGKVIFLIDNVHWNGNKFSELKQFIERCPGNKFLMCADDSAYSWGKSSGQAKNLQLGADTDIVSLLPLRRKNLRAMIAKFTGQEEDNVDEIFKTITKTIKSSYLPNNNFVYTVLCEIYLSKGRLDAVLTEADIIENYIEILLKKHCELLLKDDKKAPYKTILNFLGYFCVAMFNKHITAMLKIEFEMLILEYNKLNFFPYNLESYEKPLLDSGVLRINSNDEYYFSQRCFFDFACSAYVDSNDAFKSTVLSEEHYLNADKVIEYYSAGGGKNNTLLIDMLADQLLVVLARGPQHELRRVVGLLGGLGHCPGPRPQPARALGLVHRGEGVADLAGRLADGGVLERAGGRRRVVPHRHLALAERVQALAEPGLRCTGLAVGLNQVDVELDRLGELGGVHLGGVVLLEPGAAEGVDHRRQRGEHLAPAGQATKADALHAGLCAVDLGRDVGDLLPGRTLGHRDALGRQDVLAVHQHRGLAVERDGVQLAVRAGERVDHRLEHVCLVERGVLVGVAADLVQPVVLGPDRHLVRADGGDVVLARLGGDVLGDLVAQLVLGQHRVVHLDAGVLGEAVGGELLDVLHLGVAHHQDVERTTLARTTGDGGTAAAAGAGAAGRHQHRGDQAGRGGPAPADAVSCHVSS